MACCSHVNRRLNYHDFLLFMRPYSLFFCCCNQRTRSHGRPWSGPGKKRQRLLGKKWGPLVEPQTHEHAQGLPISPSRAPRLAPVTNHVCIHSMHYSKRYPPSSRGCITQFHAHHICLSYTTCTWPKIWPFHHSPCSHSPPSASSLPPHVSSSASPTRLPRSRAMSS